MIMECEGWAKERVCCSNGWLFSYLGVLKENLNSWLFGGFTYQLLRRILFMRNGKNTHSTLNFKEGLLDSRYSVQPEIGSSWKCDLFAPHGSTFEFLAM